MSDDNTEEKSKEKKEREREKKKAARIRHNSERKLGKTDGKFLRLVKYS